MKVIGKDMVVTMRFQMKNGRGEILESRMEGEPACYLHGGEEIAGSLQQALEGLGVGDRKTVYLRRGEEGAEDDFVFEVEIEGLRDATAEELLAGKPLSAMRIYVLSGFLGSGKTTAIREACRLLLEGGRRVAVITNDQGSRLVDGGFFRGLGIASRQVMNGCFCCRYDELDASVSALQKEGRPEIIFAESVGSCTDIVATVLNPLLRYRQDLRPAFAVFADGILLLSVLEGRGPGFDAEVQYIYDKQLEEAEMIVVSKVDLLTDEERAVLEGLVRVRYGEKRLLWQNSYDSGDVLRWLGEMNIMRVEGLVTPGIDYAIYGEGEAKLAWLDEELLIKGQDGGRMAEELARKIYEVIAERGYPIGHLKFLVNGEIKVSMGAGRGEGEWKKSAVRDGPARLLINARVQAPPDKLRQLVTEVVDWCAMANGCEIEVLGIDSFQPGFPEPAYRIPG